MDIKQSQQFKKQLEKNKKEIERQIKGLRQMPDFGDDTDSLEEEAQESEEFSNQMAMMQEYKNRLADIESALNKIAKNRYGACEKCKKEISLEILNVAPESRLCKECKKRKE